MFPAANILTSFSFFVKKIENCICIKILMSSILVLFETESRKILDICYVWCYWNFILFYFSGSMRIFKNYAQAFYSLVIFYY